MKDLESVLNGSDTEAADVAPAQEQAPEQQSPAEAQEPVGDTTAPDAPAAVEGEPPAPGQEKSVPLAALEAERKQRQDWKEKAIRYEEQLKAAQAQPAHAQQQPQGGHPVAGYESMPPEVRAQVDAFDQRAHVSEMLARNKYGDESVDKHHAAFAEAVQENPSLQAELLRQQNPWEFVYQQGARALALKEIGTDPSAYRERVKEEIRQQMLAEQGQAQLQPFQAQPNAAAALPPSLASARSTASRSTPAFTGPTPLDSILKRG